MQLTITVVDHAPADLYGQVPLTIELLRETPGTDRPDYWLGELRTFWGHGFDRLEARLLEIRRQMGRPGADTET